MNDPSAPQASAALDKSEAEELAIELEKRERAARRHTIWAVLGVSPAGLIPLIAATNDFGVAALVVGVVCITGIEAWRAAKARGDASELRAKLDSRAPSRASPRN